MEETIYYIIIQNRNYLHEFGETDYHLEMIPSNRIHEIIKKEEFHFQVKTTKMSFTNHFVVTNDVKLLEKYIFAINVDEFNAMCRKKNYNKDKIRINLDFFGTFSFEEDLYTFLQDILKEKITSASMKWETITSYPYEDERDGVNSEYFRGWYIDEILYYQN